MDILDARDQLIGKKKDRLQRKLAVAKVEQILQRRAEKVEDHGIVITLGAEPANEGDPDAAGKRLVDAGLILKLGVLGLHALKFDGNLLAGDDVSAEVNVTE